MFHSESSNQRVGFIVSHGMFTPPQPASSINIQVNDNRPNTHPLLHQHAHVNSFTIDAVRYSSNTPATRINPFHRLAPPPLSIQRSIPLPALSDNPIAVHPLLTYTPWAPPPIIYDLSFPPTTALPAPAQTQRGSQMSDPEDWRTYPAIVSSAIGSITIRVPRIDRPVVVLPENLEQRVPTIGDVLDAIYSVIRLECMIELESRMPIGPGAYSINLTLAGGDQRRRSRVLCPYLAAVDNLLVAAIRNRLGNTCIWMGLYPSEEENDVWVLRTRGLSHY